jgi:rod shape-determining protein MreC
MRPDWRRSRVVLALLLLGSFTLVTVDAASDPSPLDAVRAAVAEATAPLQLGARTVARPFVNATSDLATLGRQRHDLRRLREENAKLRGQLRAATERQAEARAAKRLIADRRTVPARVIGFGAYQSFAHTVTIDAGRRDGVRPNQTVVAGDGLVGRVLNAGTANATVLLIGDATSAVGARMASSRELGFVRGEGDVIGKARLTLQLLDHEVRVSPGDTLVTWGSPNGSPYVAGIPIGRVVSVDKAPAGLAPTAVVEPYADLTALDVVGVIAVVS